MPTRTLNEFRVWLLERIDLLTDLCEPMPPQAGVPKGAADAPQQGVLDCAAADVAVLEQASDVDDEEEKPEWPGPDLSVFEDAADIVREAGEIALRLGLPDLYSGTRVRSPMLAIPVAKELLGRCLAACNELIAKTAPTVSTAVAVMGGAGSHEEGMASLEMAADATDGRQNLPLSCQRAYQQFKGAEERLGEVTDKEVYDWLKDDNDTQLPPFDTWTRYLRAARRHYGTQKNTPRAGRTGLSVVKWGEIEHPRKNKGDDD